MTALTDLTSSYVNVLNRQSITGLTRSQATALEFIRGYIGKHGFSPTYQEITDGIGRTSKGNVKYLIDGLIRRGHLVRTEGRARSIELVRKSCPNCGASA